MYVLAYYYIIVVCARTKLHRTRKVGRVGLAHPSRTTRLLKNASLTKTVTLICYIELTIGTVPATASRRLLFTLHDTVRYERSR